MFKVLSNIIFVRFLLLLDENLFIVVVSVNFEVLLVVWVRFMFLFIVIVILVFGELVIWKLFVIGDVIIVIFMVEFVLEELGFIVRELFVGVVLFVKINEFSIKVFILVICKFDSNFVVMFIVVLVDCVIVVVVDIIVIKFSVKNSFNFFIIKCVYVRLKRWC